MMVLEMQKKNPYLQLLDELMTLTFSQRRQEIIGDEPLIAEVFNRWPGFFTERQIQVEFKRVVAIDLYQCFLDGLDALVRRLLEVYKVAAKSGKKQALKDILDCLENDNTNERRRTAALLGLPYYLSEEPANVVRMCDAHAETLDVAMRGMLVGLLIGYEGVLQEALPQEIFNVAVVAEDTIVLHNLKDVPCSFAILMGMNVTKLLQEPLLHNLSASLS
ncbi:uncharacterized protein LOC143510083 [Brachyhypopomus gauderio]|uniref:uncharacterized protein LOC143510083 n=1 Tax=Brachyhypopomus gauderio TaxID=698409 RepID=UPI004042F270